MLAAPATTWSLRAVSAFLIRSWPTSFKEVVSKRLLCAGIEKRIVGKPSLWENPPVIEVPDITTGTSFRGDSEKCFFIIGIVYII